MFLHISIDYPKLSVLKPEKLQLSETDSYFVVKNASKSIVATIKKRHHTPMTYCIQQDEQTVEFGYHTPKEGLGAEFLAITIKANGRITVKRDGKATLPLLYGLANGHLNISNQYETVTSSINRLHIREADIANILAPHHSLSPTLWNEIKWIKEYEQLIVADGQARIIPAQQRHWAINADLPESDPKEFIDRLDNALDVTLQTYTTDAPYGFELSGGLDSPILPLFLTRGAPHQTWHSNSIILAEPYRSAQLTKLQTLQAIAPNGYMHFVEPAGIRHQPLARIFTTQQQPQLFYPYSDIYLELAEDMACNLQAAGAKVVFNGAGGDDLFEHNDSLEDQLGIGPKGYIARSKSLAAFATPKLERLLGAVIPQKQQSILPKRSVSASTPCIQNNVYIERDIWPVSPLNNEDLFTYCQGLPYQFRKQKAILRLYYEAKKYPTQWYDKSLPNEDFGDYFNSSLLSENYQSLFSYFVQHSYLHDAGYIDTTILAELYRKALATSANQETTEVLFTMYLWLCTELNLHTAYKTGQWQGNFAEEYTSRQ